MTHFKIFQLKENSTYRDVYVKTLNGLRGSGVKVIQEEYRCVEDAYMRFPAKTPTDEILEHIYFVYNSDDRPNRGTARSVSVSDVICIERPGEEEEAFFVEGVGMAKIDNWGKK